jgi:hypothetical protein
MFVKTSAELSETRFAGLSSTENSGLRAGFTAFLRKISGLWCFFPAHVREKTIR